MKTTSEMLSEMEAALAEHEREAGRLRAAIAALKGEPAQPSGFPRVLVYDHKHRKTGNHELFVDPLSGERFAISDMDLIASVSR